MTANLVDNQTYQLVMPNQPEKYDDAKEYAESPTLAIMQGSQVIASQNTQTSGGGLLSGVGSAIGGMFGGDSAVNANNQAIAAVQSSTPATTATTVSSTASTKDQFMQMWLNASEEDREKIRQWIQE